LSHLRLAHLIVWIWAFLLFEADLKVTLHPQIHWGITALAFCLLTPYLIRLRFRFGHFIQWHVVSMAGLLTASILVTGLPTENILYTSGQTIKMVIILLVVFPLLLAQPSLAKAGFLAAPLAVWANLGLLLLGIMISPVFASVMSSDDRWGTIFNYPGSLWRLGIMVFVFSAYALYWRRGFYYWILFVASLILIYADGSRTGALMVLLASIYVGFLTFMERRRRLITIMVWAASGLGGSLLVGMMLLGSESMASLLPQRVVDFYWGLVFGGLESVDLERLQMLQVAWQNIVEHPFWGSGIGTTRSETYEGLMVVHNSYLQVWADLGLLGLFAYTGLVLGWILWFPRFLLHVRQQTDPMLRGFYYNAAFLLFFYAFSGMFHPLSTEWSEWITFVLPYALYAEALRIPLKDNESTFQRGHNHV